MWLADDFVRSLPGFGELPERVRALVGKVPLMACDHCGEPLCYEWFRYNDDDLCSVECEEARAGGEMAYLAAYYGIWGPEQDVLSAKYDVRIPQKVKDAVFGPDATYEGAEAAMEETWRPIWNSAASSAASASLPVADGSGRNRPLDCQHAFRPNWSEQSKLGQMLQSQSLQYSKVAKSKFAHPCIA